MPRWKQSDLSSDTLFQKKRETVIREAAKTFSVKGYHGTSLDEVARVLGVTKAALYYYIPSKRDILYECLIIAEDIGAAALEKAQSTSPMGLERVTAFIRAYAGRALDDMGACLLITDLDDLERDRHADITARRAALLRGLSDFIDQGQTQGQIGPRIDPDLSARFIINALNTLPRWGKAAADQRSVDRMIEDITTLISSGMSMPIAAQ
ncbi:MAG: TetR/AcrR family transcriptional regulator [Rhodospirillum sp.]|nr:TetR/AcrR family transcriptional regulator [Rhodospirillum sp.]MCF8488516.1 TetR/AcrR family transcriptional regulator [Rhodospirillum sp.]MCF8499261.1 TetR/AcrR family transcriptional regulator [Rhodospirillum sp.]